MHIHGYAAHSFLMASLSEVLSMKCGVKKEIKSSTDTCLLFPELKLPSAELDERFLCPFHI